MQRLYKQMTTFKFIYYRMEIVVCVETNLADTGNVAIVNVRNRVQAIDDNVVEITIQLWYTKYMEVQVGFCRKLHI